MRLYWLALGAFAVLGCESFRSPAPYGPPPSSPARVPPQAVESIRPAALAVPIDPGVDAIDPRPAEPDTLALAAECLGRGDCANAAIHLESYVCRHPDQLMFRAQLAELLVRAGRDDAARSHYERFVAAAQGATGAPRTHLVTAHTRLMEIAQRQDDRFAEALHRGRGLLLLAKEQDRLADADAEFGEELLCKAIRALAEAKELQPSDPRVRVYLAEAYDRSGNRRAAWAERAAARTALLPGSLSPTERKPILLDPGFTASSAK